MTTTVLETKSTEELMKRKTELYEKINNSIDYTAEELSEFMQLCQILARRKEANEE